MIYRCSLLILLHFCLFAGVQTSFAQGEDHGLLYFPPTLTVGTYLDEDYSWWYSVVGYDTEELAMEIPEMGDRLVFTSEDRAESALLLPMIFFDQGSYIIPERYGQFTGAGEAFNYVDSGAIHRLASNYLTYELLKYYEILNVLGYRLAQSPATTIALEGGYSTGPGEDQALATERAKIVKEYLINIWKIEPERIAILPSRRMCDSTANIFKQEEAQRVAIYTNNHDLFRRVNYHITSTEGYHMLFTIRIDPRMQPEDVAGITLVIASDDDILSQTVIPANPDSTSYNMLGMWMVPRDLEKLGTALSVQAFVRGTDGRVRASEVVGIPVTIQEPEIDEPYAYSDYKDEVFVEVPQKDSAGNISGPLRSLNIYDITYEFSIPFFESSDTGLSKLQSDWMSADMDSLRYYMGLYPEGRWQINGTAYAEAGEMPDVQNAELSTQLATYRSTEGYFIATDNDPTLQLPLYFLPTLDKTQLLGLGKESFATSIRAAWYGERATEWEEALQNWKVIPFNRQQSRIGDTLALTFLTRRATGALQHILPNLTNERIDTTYAQRYLYYDNLLSFAYTPEERFYERSVTITLEISEAVESELWQKLEESYEEEYEEDIDEENLKEEEETR